MCCEKVGPQGTVTAAYDLAGRRTQLTYPGGSFYVTYDHQVTGEVTAIKESGSTSLATFAYDDLGRRTTLTLGNGVVSTYGYDNVSRMTSLGLNLSGTGDDQTLGFSYNTASQIAGTTRSNDGYAWTGAANVTRAYTSNGLNQFTASGATSLGYDTRGNLTTSGSNTYTYSSENLLLTGPGSAALTYDPLLRLYQTAATGYTATRFAYDGQSMIAEYNSSNALQKRYVFGPGGDEPLVEYDSGGTKTYLTADERGSIVARTNSSGVATAKNSYDEYGIPGGGNAGRFGYTGQAWLPELGMSYYKARMYSPTLGRFMQTDPIGYGDGMNWYNYVKGDPINLTDPSGRDGLMDDDDEESFAKASDNKKPKRVCVAQTGSRLLVCANAFDVNHDGKVDQKDIGIIESAINGNWAEVQSQLVDQAGKALESAKWDMIRTCATAQGSGGCQTAKNEYFSQFKNYNALTPLPPPGNFVRVYPSFGSVALASGGCVFGVVTIETFVAAPLLPPGAWAHRNWEVNMFLEKK